MPFDAISIGNFEDLQVSSVESNVWIASARSKKANVFYRLGTPDAAYARFHDPFLWTTNLVKHVADFLHYHKRVKIHDLKSAFHTWLLQTHGHDPIFTEWLRAFNDTDFRRVIAIQTDCLRSQVETLGGDYHKHPLWSELTCVNIPKHPLPIGTIAKTIVTPYMYSCFKHMWFGKMIQPVEPLDAPRQFSFQATHTAFVTRRLSERIYRGKVCPGDVVAIKPDQAAVTVWKKNTAPLWYFYVRKIKVMKRSNKIHGLWLYNSSDTTLSTAKYPHPDELFLSTHCQDLDEDDVVGIIPVSFFNLLDQPRDAQKLFVRSKYDIDDSAFMTLQEGDLICACERTTRKEYFQG